MKIFAFLLAFLVLGLSILPCADRNSYANGKIQLSINKASSGQETAEEDDCSPFCQCACCANFSIQPQPLSVKLDTKFLEKRSSGFLTPNIHSVSLPIWQPPQLV